MSILMIHREIKTLTDLPWLLAWISPGREGGWQSGHVDLHDIVISTIPVGRETTHLGCSQ